MNLKFKISYHPIIKMMIWHEYSLISFIVEPLNVFCYFGLYMFSPVIIFHYIIISAKIDVIASIRLDL